MSSFKSSALVVSNKASTVTPTISGDLSIVARNNHLQVFDGTTENQIIYTSEVGSISGSLNTLILNEITNRINADILLTPLTTTSSISAGLDSRITTISNNYATKATPISGTYNNVVVNSQGIVTSGGNIPYITSSSLTPYTLLTTTQSISGNLQNQINAIAQESTSIASSGGSILVNKIGNAFNLEVASAPISNHNSLLGLQGGISSQYYHLTSTQYASISGGIDLSAYTPLTTTSSISGNLQGQITSNTNNITSISGSLSNYTLLSTTSSISAGLDSRITTINNNYATKATPISGTYNNVVVNSQGIITSGGNVSYITSSSLTPYTLLTTTQAISGNLQGQITTNSNLITTNTGNIATISGALSNYTLLSTTSSISGSLNTLIINEVNNRTNADLLLTPLTTTSSISAGLDSRIATINNNYATKATPISGTYNNVVVNSQGIVTSGGNISYITSSDLSAYVPYTGATSDVNLGTHKVTLDAISFNAYPVAPVAPRQISWNETDKTFDMGLTTNVTLQVGQETLTKVYNGTGVTITNGQPVYITGITNEYPSFALASALGGGEDFASLCAGIATETIYPSGTGFITNKGKIRGLNTSGYTTGETIYLGEIAGTFTTQTSGFAFSSHINPIGYVGLVDAISGSIYVDVRNNESTLLSLSERETNIVLGNSISTGLYTSSPMTIATSSSFTIPPLKGWIVENTGVYALEPKVTNVIFAGGTYTVTNISTQPQTFILVNKNNQIIQQATQPTPSERRANIYLGKVVHNNLVSINTINNTADYDTSPFSALRDMFAPIALMNGGVVISPNGSNLSIARSSGTIYGLGINWSSDQTNPNTIALSGQPLVTIRSIVTRSTLVSQNQTVIDPTNYDLNGTLTTVGGGSNESTNQRVYQFPNGNIIVQYGQVTYSNLAAAVAGIATESHIPYTTVPQSAILIAYISVNKNATNLSNSAQAVITPAGIFGQVVGGTSSLSTTTLQQAYDNSITPEIVISAALDGLTLKNGTGNADNITHLLEGQNTAGIVTSFTMADGNAHFSGLTASNISGSSGSIVTHDSNGKLLDSGILATSLASTSIVSNISGGLNIRIGTLEEIVTKTGEPRGFENRTSSTMSFNESTRTFNISGSFSIWQAGVKYAKTSDTQVIANTTGTHYIFYSATNVFSYSMTPWDILTDVPIAIIVWDATTQKGILVEERHGIIMDSVNHKYLHTTKGTQLVTAGALSGYTPTEASPTIDGQRYGIGATTIADEDLFTTTSAFIDGSNYTCVSRTSSGSDWKITTGRNLPFLLGTPNSYIAYNLNTGGTWSLADLSTNNYVNYYIVAIPAISTTYQYVLVPGQATYNSLALAQGEAPSNLDLTGFPFAEFVFIYRVTYRYSSSYSLTNRGRIEAVASINSNIITSGIVPSSNHNSLSGLQGGTTGEYYHLTSSQSNDFIGSSTVSNISGSLLNGISASLTYDISGNLSTYTSSKGTKTFTYSNGLLVSISGTGEYSSKTLSYSGGILQSITVL